MKNKIYYIALLLSLSSSAQVGIDTTTPNPSAALDINSTTKGLLPPRMTYIQRNAILSPPAGLIVWCTNCGINGEMQVFNGIIWTNFLGGNAAKQECRVPTINGGYLTFKCHNLGADETADPFTPNWKLNGAYIQWGKRGPIGNWQTEESNGTIGFAAAPNGDTAGKANDGIVANWNNTIAPNGAWNVTEASPIKTVDDPCPNGYRVPTRNEWASIVSNTWNNTGTWLNSPTNYSSGKKNNNFLYLPAAGLIGLNSTMYSRGVVGSYWSSTENNFQSFNFFFGENVLTISYNNRQNGLSVRCVSE